MLIPKVTIKNIGIDDYIQSTTVSTWIPYGVPPEVNVELISLLINYKMIVRHQQQMKELLSCC